MKRYNENKYKLTLWKLQNNFKTTLKRKKQTKFSKINIQQSIEEFSL